MTFWQQILISIIPAILVLAGVFITNRNSFKRLKYEFGKNEKKAQKLSYQKQIEQLYQLERKYFYALTDFHWFYILFFSGEIDKAELDKKIIKTMELRRNLYIEIEQKINFYFQEIKASGERLESANSNLIDSFVKKINHLVVPNRETAENYKKALKLVEPIHNEVSVDITKLSKIRYQKIET